MINIDDSFFSLESLLALTEKRQPEFKNMLAVLEKRLPERPVLFEFFMNNEIYSMLSGIDFALLGNDFDKLLLPTMKAFRNAGYDYFTVTSKLRFPMKSHATGKSISQNDTAMITDRKSFDAYIWPEVSKIDFSYLQMLNENILPGMKCIPCGPGGVLENATMILGYENMCIQLFDDPQLVYDVFEKVGSTLLEYYDKVLDYECVGASIVNDDWGYRTQTMLNVADMRRLVMPWHREIVRRIHRSGLPAILHSCGELKEVYGDIIDDLDFDAKHSYEDAIMPVEDFYEEYVGRIAVLGGIDLNFVCTGKPGEIYERSLAMLDRASKRGGYALGTGNSVPYYVPPKNYFAMLLAALNR